MSYSIILCNWNADGRIYRIMSREIRPLSINTYSSITTYWNILPNGQKFGYIYWVNTYSFLTDVQISLLVTPLLLKHFMLKIFNLPAQPVHRDQNPFAPGEEKSSSDRHSQRQKKAFLRKCHLWSIENVQRQIGLFHKEKKVVIVQPISRADHPNTI